MRDADCWTDHRLVHANMSIKINPPARKQAGRKHLNRSVLQDPYRHDALNSALERGLSHEPEHVPAATSATENMTKEWNAISSVLLEATAGEIGYSKRKHQDWFDNNSPEIHTLLCSCEYSSAALPAQCAAVCT